jgi:hypothetical protein
VNVLSTATEFIIVFYHDASSQLTDTEITTTSVCGSTNFFEIEKETSYLKKMGTAGLD